MTAPGEETEQLYQTIFRELPDVAVVLLDERGVILGWNRGAVEIFGYSEQEIVGQHFSILFMPEERQRNVPEMELTNAQRHGRAEDVRWHLRKDGSRFFADGVTSAFRGVGGRHVYAKVTRDITHRWLTENRLATQLAIADVLTTDKTLDLTARDLMQSICTNLSWDIGGLWLVEDDRLVLRCMDAWHSGAISEGQVAQLCQVGTLERGVGLPGRVLATGEPAWIIDLLQDPNFPRAAVAARLGIRSGFAFPLIHEGQVLGVMEFFSSQCREPDQSLMPMMAMIGARVGEHFVRRRTAEALRASEERYRVISETAQGAILTITADSTILFANPATEHVLGYEPQELVGQKLDIIIPERFRAAHYAGMARFLATGERRISWEGTELVARHKSGREMPIIVSFGFWKSDNKTIFTGFVYDISDRKRMEMEREQLLREAQAANRSKDFFLATVSHELRTPLTSILGWTRILREERCAPETFQVALDSIENSAAMQSKLVNDLVDFSRILSGKLRLEDRSLDLRQVVSAAVQSLAPESDRRKIRINVHAPAAVHSHGDPQRLQQVVWNLLSNALKFSHEGNTVDVTIRPVREAAEIEVRDYGEGIAAEDLPALFEPFRQVVEGRHGGLGLGLAIVSEIVERHGGSVSVTSDGPGTGATFTVKLPIGTVGEMPVATQAKPSVG